MKILLTLLLAIYMNAAGLSEQGENGRELYSEADCQKCHGIDESYVRKNKEERKTDVGKWVRACDGFFSIGWFPEEQADVEQYLKEVYYKN